MQKKLEEIFKQAFGVDHLTDDMSIENVEGWDSMAHVALILTLQNEFNVSISPAEAIELTDVTKIKNFIEEHQ